MMEELLRELKRLNSTLERIADALSPVLDESVLDKYVAFRVTVLQGRLSLKGIEQPEPITFEELKGIEHALERLKTNTLQFLKGLPSNHVLLYGPRGVGKSSSVRALLNEYSPEGLRLVEVHKKDLFLLPELLSILKKRKERFIIFTDDLSFDREDSSFRELKAMLDGGIERHPENILFYATSNRRHLMPESVTDNLPQDINGELHPSESLEERISLSDRFGLRIGFGQFGPDTYLDIVKNYVRLRKIDISEDELKRLALQWALSRGNYSGRTARQFVDNLEGQRRLNE
ncbi:MAG: ATP-binding protein [Nitrospirae bacterium]|nr:MAG: ATP-binding protein [Nitrospirota bacterium]